MPVTNPEFQTFYVIAKLIDSLFPNGKLYIARWWDDGDEVLCYHAAVVELSMIESDVVKRRVLMGTGLHGKRIDALDTLLTHLENVADKRLDEYGPEEETIQG
jgi:hypothetical protein